MSVAEQILMVWDVANASEAEYRFKKLAEKIASADSDTESTNIEKTTIAFVKRMEKAQVLTQLARSVGLQDRFEEAYSLLDQAEAIWDKFKNQPQENDTNHSISVLFVRINIEKGRIHNSSGQPQQAIPFFRTACYEAQKYPKDPVLRYLLIDALHMLAIAAPSVTDKSKYADLGIKIAENENSDQRVKNWLGPLLNNAAWDAVDNGRFEDAISLFQRAVVIRKGSVDQLDNAQITSLTSEDMKKAKDKRVTAWKIARWSVGHAQILAGKDADALSTLSNILEDGMDGPAIREDLARLYAKRNDKIAAQHAQKVLDFGVSSSKAEEMEKIKAQFSA